MHAGLARLNRPLRAVGVDVAGACTIPQLHDRVVDLDRPLEFDVGSRPILIRVATAAIRLQRRQFPGNHLRVRRVAACTSKRGAVIHERRRCVPIDDRRPGHRSVAAVAWQGRKEMPWRSARGHRAIVAARAGRRDTAVIEPGACKCHRAPVAGLASRVRNDVVDRLSSCRLSVVAAGAVGDDA
jgi:hypothetical protein